MNFQAILASIICFLGTVSSFTTLSRQTFTPKQQFVSIIHPNKLRMSSYSMDGSEYSSSESDFINDDDDTNDFSKFRDGGGNEEDETPTQELQPVAMSKNSGNRFVAFVNDRQLDTQNRDALDLHYDRIALTEDHVMFCRKACLYNEEFNQESNVDVLWSRQLLSADLKRAVGHAFCTESKTLDNVKELLSKEPVINSLSGGDLSNIPLYRWRHIRDYSLRIDDGRFGFPVMLLAMDHDPEEVGNLREEHWEKQLEALIRSEKIIAAGPLHLPTELKDDEASQLAVGDLIFYNAKNREEAIEFAESLPFAEEGLYKTMNVHFYNTLDTTGKFVSEDPMRDSPCDQMKEAMQYWGYPVEDEDTPWLNW